MNPDQTEQEISRFASESQYSIPADENPSFQIYFSHIFREAIPLAVFS